MGGKTETHLTSAAAFVEGGIQEACDDSCSICLENFSKSDPATVMCSFCDFFYYFHKWIISKDVFIWKAFVFLFSLSFFPGH